MKYTLIVSVFTLVTLSFFSCVTDSNLIPENSINLKKDDSTTAHLKYNESLKVNDEFSISFVGVNNDSRCPIDVICVWAGDAEIVLKIRKQNFEKNFILHSYLYPRTIVIDNYEIELKNVLPERKSRVKLEQSDYSIDLKIVNNSNKDHKKVYMIDSDLEWTISKDYLKINSATVEKDLLNISLSYSGGCKEHYINVFAYTAISKSIPPQLTLQISHNANNDLCEAYITRKMQFDLSVLRYSLSGYNVFYLNVYSPDGNLVAGSPFLFRKY
jgi:hypothetical protein